jgi:required for meiotic nuclear division protein 1
LLQQDGYILDPYGTGLLPQVVHIQVPVGLGSVGTSTMFSSDQPDTYGDVFIFPSGTVVAWSLPERVALRLVRETLLPAAENPHIDMVETEDLEYIENTEKDTSTITGDVVSLGTKLQARYEGESEALQFERAKVDMTLAKIAFSSGLARSTNLAVLETLLSKYFDSTRTIPALLSRGGRLPFSRSFVLQKTGQLLSVRAQLNLYSELTDSLPDLFWDSRYDLGLEGYYDQVGRALDVNVRIKILNEKMDYAQELVSVLRETKSEKHGLTLEWMIIALITIEVGFEILRLYKEHRDKPMPEVSASVD